MGNSNQSSNRSSEDYSEGSSHSGPLNSKISPFKGSNMFDYSQKSKKEVISIVNYAKDNGSFLNQCNSNEDIKIEDEMA